MHIPSSFRKKMIGAFRDQGSLWLENLEEKVNHYLAKWNLISMGPVSNLSYNYVLHVIDETGVERILKIALSSSELRNEIRALQVYDGNGCCKLLKADEEKGVILLEKFVPGKMLSELKDEEQVLEQFMKVWKAIRREAPKENDLPSIEQWASKLLACRQTDEYLNGQFSEEILGLAERYFVEINDTTELLHGDLHHENILFSEDKGWMAIDPKGVIGDQYFDVVSFLMNHLHEKENPKKVLKERVDTLSSGLSFNRERLLKAGLAMTTLSAFWSVEESDSKWVQTYEYALWFREWLEM
ncbi:aminoglycoside phosphotransferase family protein [Robertmurraya massiliosenegalensis]|uniref:aminoglycoside phosphotransferase family protein n=1 Tax=Robertmurraya TaxID=2837507 RepID=UPI0039A74741